MKYLACTAFTLCLILPPAAAEPVGNYPSLPSKVLSNYTPSKLEAHTPEEMADRARSFLSSLDKKLRAQAALPPLPAIGAAGCLARDGALVVAVAFRPAARRRGRAAARATGGLAPLRRSFSRCAAPRFWPARGDGVSRRRAR